MKILAIHGIDTGHPKAESAIDIWRIYRPLKELSKHVDWQIDSQPTIIKDMEKFKTPEDFQRSDFRDTARQLGQYDIIFSSYFPDPTIFALIHVVCEKYGTKFILDQDDDLFNVDPENPFWLAAGEQGASDLRQMSRLSKYICTTTPLLAKRLKDQSTVDAKIFTIPNYIADDYKHRLIDNGDEIVIGYFGGASHYNDLHETGMLPALEKIMHKYKNVYFECVGQPLDWYLPKARTKTIEPVKGLKWIDELFPTLSFDIALGPLRETLFTMSKSNIKWQESTRMGAAFVASNVGPYAELKPGTASLVDNTEEAWYEALDKMVSDKTFRKQTLVNAIDELENYRLEDHWQEYKQMFEDVYGA